MNQEEAFIEDIAEHPEDDTPRLVFADWLEDHGDEARAEFIRVQCQLANLDEYAEERGELVKRERELLKENETRGWGRIGSGTGNFVAGCWNTSFSTGRTF